MDGLLGIAVSTASTRGSIQVIRGLVAHRVFAQIRNGECNGNNFVDSRQSAGCKGPGDGDAEAKTLELCRKRSVLQIECKSREFKLAEPVQSGWRRGTSPCIQFHVRLDSSISSLVHKVNPKRSPRGGWWPRGVSVEELVEWMGGEIPIQPGWLGFSLSPRVL